ncbi:hypothetical protein AB1N83_011406 [Pleurotus pulmonarius]
MPALIKQARVNTTMKPDEKRNWYMSIPLLGIDGERAGNVFRALDSQPAHPRYLNVRPRDLKASCSRKTGTYLLLLPFARAP